eukprot:SAG31_NODE_4703_length_3021_cov_15.006845_1_plen_717_part_10
MMGEHELVEDDDIPLIEEHSENDESDEKEQKYDEKEQKYKEEDWKHQQQRASVWLIGDIKPETIPESVKFIILTAGLETVPKPKDSQITGTLFGIQHTDRELFTLLTEIEKKKKKRKPGKIQRQLARALRCPLAQEFWKTHQIGYADKGKGIYMVKSKIVDMAKREVRNDPGFTRVGLRNGTTWYYQDKEFTGIEDMVAYCCSLYEAHVGPDVWKLIKPSPEEMNPGEIAGIFKFKEKLKFRPTIDCASSFITRGSNIAAAVLTNVLDEVAATLGTDMVSTFAMDDTVRSNRCVEAWEEASRALGPRLKQKFRENMIEITADFTSMYTRMNSQQAANCMLELLKMSGRPDKNRKISIRYSEKRPRGKNTTTGKSVNYSRVTKKIEITAAETITILEAVQRFFPILVNTEYQTDIIQTKTASVQGQPHCPALANTLGVWCYLKLLEQIRNDSTPEFDVQYDEEGRYCRTITEPAQWETIPWNHGVAHFTCPFPTVAVAKESSRFIDDNKFTVPNWVAHRCAMYMSAYWDSMMKLESTWEFPGEDGLVQWMDYCTGYRHGQKIIQPIRKTEKIRKVPHWESYSPRNRFIMLIFNRMDQIARTCGTELSLIRRFILQFEAELTAAKIPLKWIELQIQNWVKKRKSKKINRDRDMSNILVLDYTDEINKTAIRKRITVAERSHSSTLDRIKGIIATEQTCRFKYKRKFGDLPTTDTAKTVA